MGAARPAARRLWLRRAGEGHGAGTGDVEPRPRCLRERRRGVFRRGPGGARPRRHRYLRRADRRTGGRWGRTRTHPLRFRRSAARTSVVLSLARTPALRSGRAAGMQYDRKGMVETGKFETTAVRGVYVACDASRSVQLVVIAAAEGATAAFAINTELVKEDLG